MALQKGKTEVFWVFRLSESLYLPPLCYTILATTILLFSGGLDPPRWVICWHPISRLHCFLSYTCTTEYPCSATSCRLFRPRTWFTAFFHLHALVSSHWKPRCRLKGKAKEEKKKSVCSGLTPILNEDTGCEAGPGKCSWVPKFKYSQIRRTA